MIKSGLQTQFSLHSNSSKTSFLPSQTPNISISFPKTNLKKPIISIKTTQNFVPKASSGTGVYTQLPEQTLYELLGISENVPFSEIKKAYKQMALIYHPDVSPPERAKEYTTRFIMVQEAYETLSDPESRAMYDSCMAKGLHMAFSAKKGPRFQERSDEKARWRPSWEEQLVELQRRSKMDHGGRVSWAARIRQQRNETCSHGSDLDQQGSVLI